MKLGHFFAILVVTPVSPLSLISIDWASVFYCCFTDLDLFVNRQQKQFQENPDSYNGAVRDNYSWSRSISDQTQETAKYCVLCVYGQFAMLTMSFVLSTHLCVHSIGVAY